MCVCMAVWSLSGLDFSLSHLLNYSQWCIKDYSSLCVIESVTVYITADLLLSDRVWWAGQKWAESERVKISICRTSLISRRTLTLTRTTTYQ